MSKDYIRPMPKTWWLQRKGWRWFIVRELTSVFVAAYALFLLCMAMQAGTKEDFSVFWDSLQTTGSILFHVAVFLMVTFHTITWFAAAPKALRIYRGEERVPEAIVAGGHFAAWIVVSIVVAWLVLA